jgi:hypothetical protein
LTENDSDMVKAKTEDRGMDLRHENQKLRKALAELQHWLADAEAVRGICRATPDAWAEVCSAKAKQIEELLKV